MTEAHNPNDAILIQALKDLAPEPSRRDSRFELAIQERLEKAILRENIISVAFWGIVSIVIGFAVMPLIAPYLHAIPTAWVMMVAITTSTVYALYILERTTKDSMVLAFHMASRAMPFRLVEESLP